VKLFKKPMSKFYWYDFTVLRCPRLLYQSECEFSLDLRFQRG